MGITSHMNDPSWNVWRGTRVYGPNLYEWSDLKTDVLTLSTVLGVLFTFYVWIPTKSFWRNAMISLIPAAGFQVINNSIMYGDGNPFLLNTRTWL